MSEHIIEKAGTPLLRENPCGCDPDALNALTRRVLEHLIEIVEDRRCAIGPCVALTLATAAIFNPENWNDGTEEAMREAALRYADVLEEVAGVLRKRVRQ